MSEIPAFFTLVKSVLEQIKKSSPGNNTPQYDPNQIVNCIKEIELKVMDIKKEYVTTSSNVGSLNPDILINNFQKISRNMRYKLEKKKTILSIPIKTEEYTFEFTW